MRYSWTDLISGGQITLLGGLKNAQYPQVDNLIVVAGPTLSGKSTFIKQLQNGEWPDVQQRLGIENIVDWQVHSASTVGFSAGETVEKMILHYDITRLLGKAPQPWRRAAPIAVLRAASKVTVVTIWTESEILLRRHSTWIRLAHMAEAVLDRQPLRLVKLAIADAIEGTLLAHVKYAVESLLTQRFRFRIRLAREVLCHHELWETLYGDKKALHSLYHDWISFCECQKPVTHWLWKTAGKAQYLEHVSTFER